MPDFCVRYIYCLLPGPCRHLSDTIIVITTQTLRKATIAITVITHTWVFSFSLAHIMLPNLIPLLKPIVTYKITMK